MTRLNIWFAMKGKGVEQNGASNRLNFSRQQPLKIILGVKSKDGIEVAAKSAATEPKDAAA